MAKAYRKSYEKLYEKMCWELDVAPIDISILTNDELLELVDKVLRLANCQPLTAEELNQNLI
jgi:hypothetical protein